MAVEADYLVVLCTCPDRETAESIARTLVRERLATCVNRIAGVTSIFRWKGEVQQDVEELLVIKTIGATYAGLESRIRDLHPYELPEVIAVPICHGSRDYLRWLDRGTPPPDAADD